MILTGTEIKKRVSKGDIIIAPFDDVDINPNSYNYHLSSEIIEIKQSSIFEQRDAKHLKIPTEGLIFFPNRLYLGCTDEIIGSKNYVTSLIGRSSIGRLGVFLQITADLGQLGKAHKWTLEIHVVKKIRLYPHMKIGQVSFWIPKGDLIYNYSDLYNNSNYPVLSKIITKEK